MRRIWHEHYPPGVPASVDHAAHRSLWDMFRHSAGRFAARPAFSNLGLTLSFAETASLCERFSAVLSRGLGLRKGERFAIMLPNLLQQPVAILAALRAGLVVVNVNPLYTARELREQLVDSGARAILILENIAGVLAEVVADTAVEHVILTRPGDLLSGARRLAVNIAAGRAGAGTRRLAEAHTFRALLRRAASLSAAPAAIGPGDLAFLQYTGGTTGGAKGAMLTHGNLIANVEQITAWLNGHVEEGREIIITALPLYHIFALTGNMFTFLRVGGLNYLITNPRDTRSFLREIARVPFSGITGVNTLFKAMLRDERFDKIDFRNCKLALAGGMALERSVAEQWRARTNCPLIEAYGLTEASPVVCMNPLDLPAYNARIGLPVPSTDCSIRDPAGRELDAGQIGELWVRGPQVMQGYWRRDEESRAAISADGWLRTGDLVRMDACGYIELVERLKETILVSGFNVYPREIEDVAAMHPGVLEAAAVGAPDPRSGEAVKLYVVRRDRTLTAEALLEHCRTRLAAYKIPREIEFREQLPKSAVGKILRRALKEAAR